MRFSLILSLLMPAFSLPCCPGLLTVSLQPAWNAILLMLKTSRSFGCKLSPVNFRREGARPVSYYALFKWWLLLSQHPGCLSTDTSLVTESTFGTLAGGLGCFPLDHGAYPPRSDSRDTTAGIRSLARAGRREAPTTPISVSTPNGYHPRLALKLFRIEPDICEFD